MTVPFPEPTAPAGSRAEVFSRYLELLPRPARREVARAARQELRRSRLLSGWTPLELLKHLTYVELRWLEWGFEGRDVADPWGDNRDGRWYVAPEETLDGLLAALEAQAERSGRLSPRTTSTRWASRASAGTANRPPRLSGSCFTCSRSTPVTWVTWTSCPSWPAARPANKPSAPIRQQ